MIVAARAREVQGEARRPGEVLKGVLHELERQSTDPFTAERKVDDGIRPSADVNRFTPGGMTWISEAGTPSASISSRRENSEIVRMASARRAEARVNHRRRIPSRVRNHSGWATNDRS